MRPTLPLSWQGWTFALPAWWDNIEASEDFQRYSSIGVGSAYALIAVVAVVQLVRIQMRVPEYGWTTQKVFHLLNAIVCALRSAVFFARPAVEALHPFPLRVILLDLPGLLFFTTYTLLVLFWAEIYHQARSMPTGSLRPVFIAFNAVVYTIQAIFWTLAASTTSQEMRDAGYVGSAVFLAVVCVSAAVGFLLYGGRLFLMLQRFPIESRGRRKKLREVGLVTSICAGCFSIRALVIAVSAFDRSDLEIDVANHPLVNVVYYVLVEVVPSACVLLILRKLPPKRNAQGYQAIPTGQA